MEELKVQEVKISVVQMNCETANSVKNVEKMCEYVDEAASNGARLVVLPESVCQGCVMSVEQQFEVAEQIPEGTIVQTFMKKAVEKDIYIVAGMLEVLDGKLYNTAFLVGPEGYIGKHQKAHLWDVEKMTVEAGKESLKVFNTKIGKIGIVICWDIWFPEDMRLLMLQGADLICVPTGWVPVPGQPQEETKPMSNILCMAQAHMNGVYVAAADRVGDEGPVTWLGHSIIAGPNGWALARANGTDETILYADVDLRTIKPQRRWTAQTHLVSDRRTDIYDEMLGSGLKSYRL